VQTDDQGLGLPLMGRVGLPAAASTFTLGWDETEFGRLMWWVVEMEDGMKGDKHRLIWCPYLPEPMIEEEEEPDNGTAKLLVLTHGSQAEVWSLDLVVEEYGPGPLAPGDVELGLLKIQDTGADVMDAAFSPDGSAHARASGDGQVKFF
jgi:hypothetical protein